MRGLTIPTLHTERLTLRSFRADDLDAFAAMGANAEVMQFIASGRTIERAAAWGQMAWFNGHWTLRGHGMWALARRDDDQLIGRVGFIDPPDWPALELGWLLGREHWVQGYAREAVKASLDYAWRHLNTGSLLSLIRPANERSIKLAMALGAQRTGGRDFMGGSIDEYTFHSEPT